MVSLKGHFNKPLHKVEGVNGRTEPVNYSN